MFQTTLGDSKTKIDTSLPVRLTSGNADSAYSDSSKTKGQYGGN